MSPGGQGGSQTLTQLAVEFVTTGADALKAVIAAIQQQTAQLTSAVNAMAAQMTAGFQAVTARVGEVVAGLKQIDQNAQQASADTQMALGAIVLAVNKLGVQMQQQAGRMKDGLQTVKKQADDLGTAFGKLGNLVNAGLGIGVASIVGFAKQGMALGVQGQLLQLHFERLALTISGMFRPEIQKITDMVARFTDWLQRLSAAQRESIAHWAQGAAAALAVGVALPRVLAGVQALAGGFKALGAAMTGSLSATGIGALLPLIGLLAQALIGILVGTERGREALAKLGEATRKLAESFARLAESMHLESAFAALVDGISTAIERMAKLIEYTDTYINQLNEIATKKGGSAFSDFFTFGLNEKQRDLILRAMLGAGAAEEGKGKKTGSRAPDIGRSGGFESLTATYERIARASIGVRSPEDRAADTLDEMNRRMGDWDNLFRNPRPDVAR